MRTAMLILAFSLASACSTGYVPRISTSRGPEASPTVAVDTAWEPQRPDSYDTGHGHMVAVYTNGMVGGLMAFEVVPAGGKSAAEFIEDACANLESASDMRCAAVGLIDNEDGSSAVGTIIASGDPGTIVLPTRGREARYGANIVMPMLGDKSRYLVCTGSWSLYGPTKDAVDQHNRSADQLYALCKTHALR